MGNDTNKTGTGFGGALTGIAALLTAIGGLIGIFYKAQSRTEDKPNPPIVLTYPPRAEPTITVPPPTRLPYQPAKQGDSNTAAISRPIDVDKGPELLSDKSVDSLSGFWHDQKNLLNFQFERAPKVSRAFVQDVCSAENSSNAPVLVSGFSWDGDHLMFDWNYGPNDPGTHADFNLEQGVLQGTETWPGHTMKITLRKGKAKCDH